MGTNRSEKMGARPGLAGFIDKLRYNEISRQGFGLLLVLVCAWFTLPGGENRIIAGFVVAALGQVWRIYAAGVIYKNKQLATTGAYSLVRHPLYLGNFLILIGFAVSAGNLAVLAVVIFFFAFYYPAAIRYEDHKLEGIFEDDWRSWSKGTPGMFPTSFKWRSNTEATWNTRQSLLRNGELIYTVYMVGCAVLLWYRAVV